MEKIREWIDEVLGDETGLHLEEDFPFSVTKRGGGYLIRLGSIKGEITPEEGEELNLEEAVRDFAYDRSGDIKEELLAEKMAFLEDKLLDPAREWLWKRLRDKDLPGEILEDLQVEVKDYGYFPSHHGMVEAEYVRGYPDFGLEISYLGDREIEPVGVSLKDLSGDVEDVVDELEDLLNRFWDEWEKSC